MANKDKVVTPGKTVYLSEGEDFDVVQGVDPKDIPPTVKVNPKTGEVIEEVKETEPVKETKQEDTVEEVKETEVLEEKTNSSVELASELLAKNKNSIKEDDPILPNMETSVKIEIPDDDLDEPTEENEKEVEEREIPKAKAVDISALNIINKTEIDKERDLRNALYGNKAAFQIVAAQSGYMAKVLPLVHKDIINILRENLTRYEYQKSLFEVIHEKIHDTSVGKMDFQGWLKNTSVEDIETFYYGIYASTFPNEGSFSYTCPACGAEHDYKVNHNNLIKTTDKDKMKKLIDEVSRNSTTVEKMQEYSLIGKNQAIQLSSSGLVFEIRTPSLLDLLEILRTVPEKTIDRDSTSIVYMLYVNRILIPDKEKSGYYEEIKKPAILRAIDNLPIDDANEFKAVVDERIEENRITYSLKNIKCSECGHEVKEIPISIEDILFTLIFEKAQ